MTIVYKNVRNRQGKHHSAFITGKLSLEYKLDEWTEPVIGKLFAFRTQGLAKDWGIGNEVWEAKAEGVESFQPPVFLSHIDWISRYAKSFWIRRYKFLKKHAVLSDGGPPFGTVICSRIKLLRQIH